MNPKKKRSQKGLGPSGLSRSSRACWNGSGCWNGVDLVGPRAACAERERNKKEKAEVFLSLILFCFLLLFVVKEKEVVNGLAMVSVKIAHGEGLRW